jgi:hypothetical protein
MLLIWIELNIRRISQKGLILAEAILLKFLNMVTGLLRLLSNSRA